MSTALNTTIAHFAFKCHFPWSFDLFSVLSFVYNLRKWIFGWSNFISFWLISSYTYLVCPLTNRSCFSSLHFLSPHRFFVCFGNQFENGALVKYFTNANATTHTNRRRINTGQYRTTTAFIRNGIATTAHHTIPLATAAAAGATACETWTNRSKSGGSI